MSQICMLHGGWYEGECADCKAGAPRREPCPRCKGWNKVPGVHDGDCPTRVKERRISFLERKRAAVKADLLLKFEDEDYHGVADAAMDLRDLENELCGLRFE